jgi:hypothetical protein
VEEQFTVVLQYKNTGKDNNNNPREKFLHMGLMSLNVQMFIVVKNKVFLNRITSTESEKSV